ncbi:MAG: 2-oxoglutarate dehydrogenase complex dihydrolipoyllysine-residue succinyltransferase [Proteobacteria bacterium]|nr:2-oxoglutarate dehydrogenase complex dihydrolipoyllysine-residue succinyltransferase [Pseudomonadota bacterium]
MAVEVKMPNVGESVQEGVIHKWRVKSGDFVNRDDVLVELETDKATVEVVAENSGVITIVKKQGETVAVGDVMASLDTDAKGSTAAKESTPASSKPSEKAEVKLPPPPTSSSTAPAAQSDLSPAARRITEELGVNPSQIVGTGKDGRLTKGDVIAHVESGSSKPQSGSNQANAASQPSPVKASLGSSAILGARSERREPMSMIRKRTAERLVKAQETAAILTTFNEIDMTNVMKLRNDYKDKFKEKYGVGLGFMSFFMKAAIEALKTFPAVNGWIEGNEIVYHDYYDIGVAVSSNRGLVVPVVRNAERLSVAELEMAVGDYGKRAKDGKLTIDEMTGGTFTVSNGGVFGSLMSTPILNPPQSAILGMHKIQERPVVVGGQIVIRPMMYVALSYDHRIIDGRESVGFLVKIKECVEDPSRILVGV